MEKRKTTVRYAILNEDKNVVVVDYAQWADWIRSDEDFANRTLKKTMIEGIRVSTMFIGVSFDHFKRVPDRLWFETMIVGGSDEGYQKRYSTKEEALIGHEKICDSMIYKNSTKADSTLDINLNA